jgi:NDP-sugar pyrophosphorylase family protein
MDYLLYNAKKAGYQNIYIVINEKGGLFKEYYGQKPANNHFKGLNISFPIQYIAKDRIKPMGTANAVFQAVEQFPELNSQQYTVCNSDNLYSEASLKALRETNNLNAFIRYDRDAIKFSLEKIFRFAIISLDDKNYLKNIIEKPAIEFADDYQDNL